MSFGFTRLQTQPEIPPHTAGVGCLAGDSSTEQNVSMLNAPCWFSIILNFFNRLWIKQVHLPPPHQVLFHEPDTDEQPSDRSLRL